MPRKPSFKKYTETVGAISVGWNQLERALNVMGHHYLATDTNISAYLFALLGNQSKSDFISFLVEQHEENREIASAAKHFIRAFNILRQNRNTIQHATPHLDRDKRYLGSIVKAGRKGQTLPYDVPMDDMEIMQKDLNRFWKYAQLIVAAAGMGDDDQDTQNAMARVLNLKDNFPLPQQMTLLPPEVDQTTD